MMHRSRWLWPCLALGLLPGLAQAAAIPSAYQQVSSAFGLPRGLLYAIALTESGRRYPEGRVQPWPWTLNVAGAPHYYPTRSTACHALRALIGHGQHNVDIGLMQINWRWHHTQLVAPCRGLSPSANLRLAARLLCHRYRQTHDWWIAAGRYHDPGRNRASIAAAWTYRTRVLHYWRGFATRMTRAKRSARRLIWVTAHQATQPRLIWIADRKPGANPLAGMGAR